MQKHIVSALFYITYITRLKSITHDTRDHTFLG